MLSQLGAEVETADDGAQGLAAVERSDFDLIFMDIVMPGVNGYQATRMLVNDPETSLIPIIMVTTKGQETDRVWGLRQGAVDYLVKPVSAQALVEKAATLLTFILLGHWLEMRSIAQAVALPRASNPGSESTPWAFSR